MFALAALLLQAGSSGAMPATEYFTCKLNGNPKGTEDPTSIHLQLDEAYSVIRYAVVTSANENQYSERLTRIAYTPDKVKFHLFTFDRKAKSVSHTFGGRTISGPCAAGSWFWER